MLKNFLFDLLQLRSAPRFDADREARARVAYADPCPCALTEVNACAVECDNRIVLGKMFRDVLNDSNLSVVSAVWTEFGHLEDAGESGDERGECCWLVHC